MDYAKTSLRRNTVRKDKSHILASSVVFDMWCWGKRSEQAAQNQNVSSGSGSVSQRHTGHRALWQGVPRRPGAVVGLGKGKPLLAIKVCVFTLQQQPWAAALATCGADLYVFSHVTAARVRWAVSPFKKLHRAALDRGLAQSGSSIFKDWGREGRRQRRPNCFVAYTAVSPE